jgi:DNA-binding SARP family transcriptional activator
VLGELEVWRDGRRVDLPQSKKTRALLAYLAVTARPHRRERLCDLLWDVADDPRAALRWSLSRLRPLVDDPAQRRVEGGAGTVGFATAATRIDLFVARDALTDAGAATTDDLLTLAAEFRGPFLEGLELPDFLEFQSWCLALREESRALHARLLTTLLDRLASTPDVALPHARALAQIEPFDEDAHVRLVRLLLVAGRGREAEQHAASAQRLLQQADPEAGRSLRAALAGATTTTPPVPSAVAVERVQAHDIDLVGRDDEQAQLRTLLDDATKRQRLRAVLLLGEPGIGKTRLLAALAAEARERGATVLEGRAFEAESGRPYGPWIDALRQLPPVAIGTTLGRELAPLLPELGAPGAGEHSRDRLFGAVVELLAARAHSAPPVLVVLDDLHWCDDASAELLHYVARLSRHRAVVLALAARTGELADNLPLARVLRGLRHDGGLDEIELPPLEVPALATLVGRIAPEADPAEVFAASSGNPLFALEIARRLPHCDGTPPPTLRRMVRDRVERLPADAADVLRWAAVIGQTFAAERLGAVAQIEAERLVTVLSDLERFAMLRALPSDGRFAGSYGFAHDVVRQVVHAEISEPRRRLMHQRVVDALRAAGGNDEQRRAADLAWHAAQAGDAATAARACLDAARACLRVFAAAEADALARRGAHYARELREPERVEILLELAEVRHGARRPQDTEAVSAEVESLARLALSLDRPAHARLGFHLASWVRWEGGNWSDAQRQMLRAEEVSRAMKGRERAAALGEAARCLALLERDLGQAEALALEAQGLSAALETVPSAIPDAIGMLRLHEGKLDEAALRFAEARTLCRREQDRLGEFHTVEHQIMLELRRARFAEARRLADELVEVAARLREGSEVPFARVLAALARHLDDHTTSSQVADELEAALAELRRADAKQRLGYALTRASEADLRRGDAAAARGRAEEALRLALVLERPSDVVLARVGLVKAARAGGDAALAAQETIALDAVAPRLVSEEARAALAGLRGDEPTRARRARASRGRR